MMRLIRALTCLLLLALPAAAGAQALVGVPKLESPVTDLTGTLTAAQQAELEQKLIDFQRRKGAQVALLMVPTTAPEAIEQYAIRVVDAWKLGREKPDDGVLLVVALQDRRVRIEVGYGLEGALTDATSRRIIGDTITPLFRQGDFYGGVSAGLQKIMAVVEGEALPPPDHGWSGSGEMRGNKLLFGLFIVMMIGSALGAFGGRLLGSLGGGAVAGFVVFLITHSVALAVLAGIGLLVFTLLGAFSHVARGLGGGGFGGGGLGGGGFGGGGFGGGGGGGGFSGGGGGFGGGGASGNW